MSGILINRADYTRHRIARSIQRTHMNMSALRSVSPAAARLFVDRKLDEIFGENVLPEERRAMSMVNLDANDPDNVVAFRNNRGGAVPFGDPIE